MMRHHGVDEVLQNSEKTAGTPKTGPKNEHKEDIDFHPIQSLTSSKNSSEIQRNRQKNAVPLSI
jgi:hypothetical protein